MMAADSAQADGKHSSRHCSGFRPDSLSGLPRTGASHCDSAKIAKCFGFAPPRSTFEGRRTRGTRQGENGKWAGQNFHKGQGKVAHRSGKTSIGVREK